VTEVTINTTTIGGTQMFCDWLIQKGYASQSQANPWKGALKQVFSTVDGEEYESVDWSNLDLDEYLDRFQKLSAGQYKIESVVAYGRRVRNALDAHRQFLETGKPPVARTVRKREKPAEAKSNETETPVVSITKNQPQPGQVQQHADMVVFPYPLDDGQLASLTLPRRLTDADATRLATFIRTLVDEAPEQKQLPRPEGEQAA
jgi:hypothetical protein